MAGVSQENKLSELHDRALRQFDAIQGAVREERMQCLSDRRFYSIAGAQWEGALAAQFENKPRFEVNKIHLAVIKIINEYRNNRVSVTFVPKDGGDGGKTAENANNLYRADMEDSNGDEAKDNAFEDGVGGGFGAWRLRACEEDEYDEDNDRQRIRIEPIFDADSCVFFDINAKRQDKSDAKHAYILSAMSYDSYKEEYNDDPATWPKPVSLQQFDWLVGKDTVYIAEYYECEIKKEKLHVFRGLTGEEQKYSAQELEENDGELQRFLAATGQREVRQKTVKRKRIHKYILSGGGVLEDCGYIAGKNIPIVPYYGKRWVIDNVERCMGHVRLAKDSQRLKNMQVSKLGETAALSAIEKPILTPEQTAGHEVMWAEDNVKNYPYLNINAITDMNGNPTAVGPQAYTRAPNVPPAMAALLQLTEQDMRDILGGSDSAEQINPQISGVAMELQQTRLDMQTFIYMSNFAKAEKRCGEIWLGMAREIYVEDGRKMKGITDHGETTSVEINRPVLNAESGETEYENDLSEADFDVTAVVGPSSASRRMATVRAITGIMGIVPDPETQQVLAATAMMNLDAEGIEDIRGYFRQKLLRMGVVKPTQEEQQQLMAEQQQAANQPPDANTVFLRAAAEKEQAGAAKARAETVYTMTKADQTRADTAKTIAETSQTRADTAKTMAETHLDAATTYLQTLERLSAGNQQFQVSGAPQVVEQPTAPVLPTDGRA